MRKVLATITVALCACGIARAAHRDRLVLPLPSQGGNVSVSISRGIKLVAVPDEGNWIIRAYDVGAEDAQDDLLFPSTQWHGPAPKQVEAWQVLKHYGFGNTRWICVRGHKIEVKLQIRNARVKPVTGGAMFTAGQLVVEWFHRSCRDYPRTKSAGGGSSAARVGRE